MSAYNFSRLYIGWTHKLAELRFEEEHNTLQASKVAGYNHIETVHVKDANGEMLYACVIDAAQGLYLWLQDKYSKQPLCDEPWLFVEDAQAFVDMLAYELIARKQWQTDNAWQPRLYPAELLTNPADFFDPKTVLLPERLRRYHTRETLIRQWLPKEKADQLLTPPRSGPGINGHPVAERQAEIWYELCKAAGL